jgi:hypothetical protein
MDSKRIISSVMLILLLANTVVASSPATWVAGMKKVAVALGWMMMVLMGIKWMLADSPNERGEAKKGMLYVVIGLLVIASSCSLLRLYTDTASNAMSSAGGSFSISGSSVGC